MITEEDKTRIQLSIVFITFYIGIILAYRDKLNFASFTSGNFFSQLLFGVFILCGIIVILHLFFYLLLTALELNFHKEKELVFNQTISTEKLVKLKMTFYNVGVGSIFSSLIAYPIYFFYAILKSAYKLPWSFLIWLFCLLLIIILINILFSDRKIIIKKSIQDNNNTPVK